MCRAGTKLKCVSAPILAVIISILLETSLISIHAYVYQQSLVSALVDEIFLGLTLVFLILSIAWLFVSAYEPIYSHFRFVRGAQAVIMVTNGLMLVISTFQTKLSDTCAHIEEQNAGIKCQAFFELRLIVGCLAVSDAIFYFFRRPTSLSDLRQMGSEDEERLRRESTQSSQLSSNNSENQRRNKKGHGKGKGLRGLVIEIQREPKKFQSQEQLTNDYILKLDISKSQAHQQQQVQVQQQQRNFSSSLASPISDMEDEVFVSGRVGGNDSLEEMVKRTSVQTSPTNFYFNSSQEYFLPKVAPTTSSSSKPTGDEERFSTLTRDFNAYL